MEPGGRRCTISDRQAQRKFKHAAVFGVQGPYSPANGERFKDAIRRVVNNTTTVHVRGTYNRGAGSDGFPADFSCEPTSRVVVVVNLDGAFVTGFQMSGRSQSSSSAPAAWVEGDERTLLSTAKKLQSRSSGEEQRRMAMATTDQKTDIGSGSTATLANDAIGDYVALMKAFLGDKMSGQEFERRYLDLFGNDVVERPLETFQALNDVFFAVDAYCADPTLREPDDLDEDQLRARVDVSLAALTS